MKEKIFEIIARGNNKTGDPIETFVKNLEDNNMTLNYLDLTSPVKQESLDSVADEICRELIAMINSLTKEGLEDVSVSRSYNPSDDTHSFVFKRFRKFFAYRISSDELMVIRNNSMEFVNFSKNSIIGTFGSEAIAMEKEEVNRKLYLNQDILSEFILRVCKEVQSIEATVSRLRVYHTRTFKNDGVKFEFNYLGRSIDMCFSRQDILNNIPLHITVDLLLKDIMEKLNVVFIKDGGFY